jgi:3-oxo-5-alpha-steroid 4-dehydrogenase 1
MEIISPLTFIYTFYRSPLTFLPSYTPHLNLSNPASHPPLLLSALFITHYLNRAIISPLRSPGRNKSHICVPLCAVVFNLVNGFLMGAYLSSPLARGMTRGAFGRWRFWVGLGMWAVGFVGNVVHDEILYDIRRKAKAKGKAKEESPPTDSNSTDQKTQQKPHYAIPHGLLYTYLSYPNYFCEWIEWLGFALAASPPPSFTSFERFMNTINPPWVFLCGEVVLMLPRAVKGHRWYRERFREYPKERRAIVPWLI